MKGKTFTVADLSKRIRSKPDAITKPLMEALTARYRVVAVDPGAAEGRREIIAEELAARIIAAVPEKARRLVPLLMRMPAADRVALLRAFDGEGRLINPFKLL